MRKLLITLLLFPVLALAEGMPKDKTAGAPDAQRGPDAERMVKRMRLARTLGLAEALDLDAAQALKLGDVMAKFDDRRKAVHQQAVEANEVLRKAARGDKASFGDVDGAISKLLDARTQMATIDKEGLATITKDLTPEQKARAALFLGRFRQRIEQHVMRARMGMGGGMPGGMGAQCPMGQGGKMGPGMHPGMMEGHGAHGAMMMQPGTDRFAARLPGAADDAGDDDAVPFADDED
jgi:ribosomal protein L13E